MVNTEGTATISSFRIIKSCLQLYILTLTVVQPHQRQLSTAITTPTKLKDRGKQLIIKGITTVKVKIVFCMVYSPGHCHYGLQDRKEYAILLQSQPRIAAQPGHGRLSTTLWRGNGPYWPWLPYHIRILLSLHRTRLKCRKQIGIISLIFTFLSKQHFWEITPGELFYCHGSWMHLIYHIWDKAKTG